MKLHNATVIDGEYYVIPHIDGRSHIGAVVGMGDTAEAAIEDCKAAAEKIEGYDIVKPVAALEKAQEDLAKIVGPEKKQSPLERKVESLRRSGRISDRQADKMMARG